MLPPYDGTQHLLFPLYRLQGEAQIPENNSGKRRSDIAPIHPLFGWSKDKGIQNILKLQRLSTAMKILSAKIFTHEQK